MRPGIAAALACACLPLLAAWAGTARQVPLPDRMADSGGGTQLITAVAASTDATTGTLTWWDRRGGRWVRTGSAPARFGARGLAEGASRRQNTDTTPTGLFDLPFGFGAKAAPAGTRVAYRRVREDSWWCQDNDSLFYNRWTQPLAGDCRASESEHLAAFVPQYDHALVIGFNYAEPVRGRGAGIFLHVDGKGATAGCVSVPEGAMRALLGWVDPGRGARIAIGTRGGATAITRY
ncbi:L,D-transpeptidase family protein [Streptomyces sp. NPDC048664]|uniref:L,D-transpeptidase family protein n=1 Tax=Streptomyces sp. NPDC048664 TaxID=3154505 RepID=UPI0034472900